jgi:hypothetical protein
MYGSAMSETSVPLREYVDRRFDDADKAVQAALASQEKAIIKAENAAEERFKLLNELRSGVATTEQLEALEKVVDDVKGRLNTSDGQTKGSQITKGNLMAYIGVAVAIVSVVVLVANNVFK